MAEANPRGGEAVRRWLTSWPRPFVSATHALQFFGGDSTWSRAWLRGLKAREGALWPRFNVDIMVACLEQTSEHSYWDEWCSISCPTLIVSGERGLLGNEVARMQALVPTARVAEIPDAGHDVHLDNPDKWQECLADYLDRVIA